jgi:hypothetical protein
MPRRKPRPPNLLPKHLTAKQAAFVRAIMQGMSKANAYRHAYDTRGCSPKTATQAGQRVARHPLIQQAIKICVAASPNAINRILDGFVADVAGEPIEEIKEPKPVAVLSKSSPLVKLLAEGEGMADALLKRDAIAQRLTMLANANMLDIATWNDKTGLKLKPSSELTRAEAYGIASITCTKNKGGGFRWSIKLEDRNKALIDLAKMMGLFDPDREDPPPPAEKAQKRKELLDKLRSILADRESGVQVVDIDPIDEEATNGEP